jgi:hypothetical protein
LAAQPAARAFSKSFMCVSFAMPCVSQKYALMPPKGQKGEFIAQRQAPRVVNLIPRTAGGIEQDFRQLRSNWACNWQKF